MTSPIHRGYVDTAFGQIHVAVAGPIGRRPIVLIHQTPRSWDEFAEVLDVFGRSRHAVAVDLPGMGASDPHPRGASIEHYAESVVAALDGMAIDEFDLVGHHTGGVVAVEIAADAPTRVHRLVLSSTPYIDADARRVRRERPPIDAVEPAADGSHLMALWNRRAGFYPSRRDDLLARFVSDALRSTNAEDGHRAVASYEMERRITLIASPTLVVGHANDPFAFGEMQPLADAVGGAETAVVDDGMVPLEYTAARFCEIVEGFLSRTS